MREFKIRVKIYERFEEGDVRNFKVKADSLYEMFKKLATKKPELSIDYYIDIEGDDKKYAKMTDQKFANYFDSSNGDGGDYFTVTENGKIWIGGNNEDDEEDLDESVKEENKKIVPINSVRPGMKGVDYAGEVGIVKEIEMVQDFESILKKYDESGAMQEAIENMDEYGILPSDWLVAVELEDSESAVYTYGSDGFVICEDNSKSKMKEATENELQLGTVYKIYDTTNNGNLVHSQAKYAGKTTKGYTFNLLNQKSREVFYPNISNFSISPTKVYVKESVEKAVRLLESVTGKKVFLR